MVKEIKTFLNEKVKNNFSYSFFRLQYYQRNEFNDKFNKKLFIYYIIKEFGSENFIEGGQKSHT